MKVDHPPVERFFAHFDVSPGDVYVADSGKLNLKLLVARIHPYVTVEHSREIPGDIEGRLTFPVGGSPLIQVNKRGYDKERQRFTLAHLLGHVEQVVVSGRYTSVERFTEYHKKLTVHRRREEEADEFAANLLMPSDVLARSVAIARTEGLSITHLAKQFGVTRTAMYVRGDRLHHW